MSIQDIILSDDYVPVDKYEGTWEGTEAFLNSIGLPLPSFVTVPDREVITIEWDPETGLFRADLGGDSELGDYSSDRLEAIYDELNRSYPEHRIEISREISGINGIEGRGGMFFMPSHRLLLSRENPRYLLAGEWYAFLETARHYLQRPDNFMRAYSFIQHHPMFWYQYPNRPDSWETDLGVRTLSQYVLGSEDEPKIALEGGSTVPGTDHHYHDYKLDVYADTFEEAYIAFAARIHELHDLDGTERNED
jgi:hypothetical protein